MDQAVIDLSKGVAEVEQGKGPDNSDPSEGIEEDPPVPQGRVFFEIRSMDSTTGAIKCLAMLDVDVRDSIAVGFRGEGNNGEEAEVYTFSFLSEVRDQNMRRRPNPDHEVLEEMLADALEEYDQSKEADEAHDAGYVPYSELSIGEKLEVIQSDLQYLEDRMFSGVLGRLLRKIT